MKGNMKEETKLSSNKTEDSTIIRPGKYNTDPFTIEELEEAIQDRIGVITKEFTDGFNFIKKYPKSVTFFGSARLTEDDEYYQKALSLAQKLSDKYYSVVTGGGPGIMEAANRGAQKGKGQSLGITIKLPHEQDTNKYVTDEVAFYYFFSRKVILSFSAEAYVYFPGGFGTLDELFEILTLVQTHKIKKVPIILFGSQYWSKLDSFIKEELITMGTISTEDVDLYHICDDEEDAISIIESSPVFYNF